MLNCFNEGFSDEESTAATNSQVPKVYLNYTKAHLENIQILKDDDDSFSLQSARGTSPHFQNLSPVKGGRREYSADKTKSDPSCTYDNYDRESCTVDVDPIQYLAENPVFEVKEKKNFTQFKRVFVNSPPARRPNSFMNVAGFAAKNRYI